MCNPDDFNSKTWIVPHCARLRELYDADDTTDKHIYKEQALQLIKEENLPPGKDIEIYFLSAPLIKNIKYMIGYDDITTVKTTFQDYCEYEMDITGGKKKRSTTRRKPKHKMSKRTTSKKTTKRPSERRLFHRPKKSVKNKKNRTKKRATRKRT
jgi:hypothetical protein